MLRIEWAEPPQFLDRFRRDPLWPAIFRAALYYPVAYRRQLWRNDRRFIRMKRIAELYLDRIAPYDDSVTDLLGNKDLSFLSEALPVFKKGLITASSQPLLRYGRRFGRCFYLKRPVRWYALRRGVSANPATRTKGKISREIIEMKRLVSLVLLSVCGLLFAAGAAPAQENTMQTTSKKTMSKTTTTQHRHRVRRMRRMRRRHERREDRREDRRETTKWRRHHRRVHRKMGEDKEMKTKPPSQ